MISIGTLEKSVNTFANKLRKAGHEVEVKAFRSGTMTGCNTQGVSNVELTVDKQTVRFMANGYGDIYKRDIGGTFMTWTEMKQEAIKKLNLSVA
ncbi:hypothetical protein [Marinobacter salsuginis]|jgi:hypothetical protein|uniref:Uncharacterized protein n=1 Tax=Marinobacter salsuginis TaxID=418719 RepID=A0A5M3Q0Z5_9GAMM|nr:hypothetical protein [Marinobacter salsuginis]GBO88736.1 hypothetical protein MSSD14B_24040 [Marinobacter salsuginis]